MFSIDNSIRTCKVDTGQAERIESDRFLNPGVMSCPRWNGVNNLGQAVCPDSFTTKTRGCNSAEDRVMVENNLRPNYSAYLNLDMSGLSGDYYGFPENLSAWENSGVTSGYNRSRHNVTGNFGRQWSANVQSSCGTANYERGLSQLHTTGRVADSRTALQNSMMARQHSGFA